MTDRPNLVFDSSIRSNEYPPDFVDERVDGSSLDRLADRIDGNLIRPYRELAKEQLAIRKRDAILEDDESGKQGRKTRLGSDGFRRPSDACVQSYPYVKVTAAIQRGLTDKPVARISIPTNMRSNG